jgi:hypothetical protein
MQVEAPAALAALVIGYDTGAWNDPVVGKSERRYARVPSAESESPRAGDLIRSDETRRKSPSADGGLSRLMADVLCGHGP